MLSLEARHVHEQDGGRLHPLVEVRPVAARKLLRDRFGDIAGQVPTLALRQVAGTGFGDRPHEHRGAAGEDDRRAREDHVQPHLPVRKGDRRASKPERREREEGGGGQSGGKAKAGRGRQSREQQDRDEVGHRGGVAPPQPARGQQIVGGGREELDTRKDSAVGGGKSVAQTERRRADHHELAAEPRGLDRTGDQILHRNGIESAGRAVVVHREAQSRLRLDGQIADAEPAIELDDNLVGFDPAVEGFFWLAGQGGYGIQTGAAAGRLASSLAQGKGLPGDIVSLGVTERAVSPGRFTQG